MHSKYIITWCTCIWVLWKSFTLRNIYILMHCRKNNNMNLIRFIINFIIYKYITHHLLQDKSSVFTNCAWIMRCETTSLVCRNHWPLSTRPHRFTKSLLLLYNNYALGKDKITWIIYKLHCRSTFLSWWLLYGNFHTQI